MSKQIFIDVETTGLDPKSHGLVQVAGAIVIDGVKKEEFNSYMCPPLDKTFEVRALEVIGMDMTEIKKFAPSEEIYEEFFSMMKKYINIYDKEDKFHFIAYNSPFDSSFIRQWFLENHNKYYGSIFWTPDICVMRMAGLRLINERHLLKNFKLETVCRHLKIKATGELHDAMIDIELTKKLYEWITSLNYDEQGGLNL